MYLRVEGIRHEAGFLGFLEQPLGAGQWGGAGFYEPGILVFVAAMLAGMGLFTVVDKMLGAAGR